MDLGFKKIGFESYERYLLSDLWHGIRDSILERDKHRCQTCGAKAEVVHHQYYDKETMLGRCPQNLISLCDRCHNFAHFDNGRPLKMQKVRQRVQRLLDLRIRERRTAPSEMPAEEIQTGPIGPKKVCKQCLKARKLPFSKLCYDCAEKLKSQPASFEVIRPACKEAPKVAKTRVAASGASKMRRFMRRQ